MAAIRDLEVGFYRIPLPERSETVTLRAGDTSAVVALNGAEPLSWRVGARELLWHGDPAHWSRSAPILFPVVGASVSGVVQVADRAYPMPQHGFARDSSFDVLDFRPDALRLCLTDSAATRVHYPFAFALEVAVTLSSDTLVLAFEVRNTGAEPMPYGLGFHPAFPWPFDAETGEGHAVVFEAVERPEVPLLTADGLLRRDTRPVALDGTRLALTPELFSQGALVFRQATSRSLRFVSPSGAAIVLAAEGFPHLALWTRPGAPFLSMEAWTAHADWEDAAGDLFTRPSMRHLAPGVAAKHRVALTYTPPGSPR